MKLFKIFMVAILAIVTSLSAHAQSDKAERNNHTKTETVKVYGECGMCKKRIEKSAFSVSGVQSANWNEDTKLLTIKHDLFSKNTADNVQKQVALAGHDTEKYTAEDAAYQQLPDCCHYQRKQ